MSSRRRVTVARMRTFSISCIQVCATTRHSSAPAIGRKKRSWRPTAARSFFSMALKKSPCQVLSRTWPIMLRTMTASTPSARLSAIHVLGEPRRSTSSA